MILSMKHIALTLPLLAGIFLLSGCNGGGNAPPGVYPVGGGAGPVYDGGGRGGGRGPDYDRGGRGGYDGGRGGYRDDCPGDSEFVNGRCRGVDEFGNLK